MLDARLDLAHASGIGLTDEWQDLAVALGWTEAAGLWCFPIRTVSRSEGGIEGVFQSTPILPHWHVTGDERGCWEVRLRIGLGAARPSAVHSDLGASESARRAVGAPTAL